MPDECLARALVGPEQRTKATRIVEPQDPVAEVEIDMIVRTGSIAGQAMAQRAGHPEMHDQCAAVETKQQVFRSAIGTREQPPGDTGIEVCRHRPAQIGPTQDRAPNAAPDKGFGKAATHDLDFG